MNEFRLTVSMPCYLRPQRTIRAIKCIAEQNTNGWEALVTGDGCPKMADFLSSGYFEDLIKDCESRGNSFLIRNHPKNRGNCGYALTNEHIIMARGRYFVFFANDDIILPNHFDHYLSEIEGSNLDFVFYNSWVNPIENVRNSNLSDGGIGHSELIIRTNFLRFLPEHKPNYGHDWDLINNMMAKTKKYKKANSIITTYHVMSLPNNQEKDID